MLPAIFLDRDGVIIENRPAYVRSLADVEFFPQALRALARISEKPYRIAVITNQAGVGKGIIPLAVAEQINRHIVEQVEKAGGRIDGVFLCPHSPGAGCSCRKPQPGLFWQAAQELEIDLSRSIMIGDTVNDLRAGQNAGVGELALVRTGLGAGQESLLAHAGLQTTYTVFDDLEQALTCLIA
jgi:D-glycero-D-manno-heptose 1,7-bisphosphate phosphatase